MEASQPWFFPSTHEIVRILIIGLLAYGTVVAILRVSGNRTLAKTAGFDHVVTVALGSTLATAVISKDTPLASSVTATLLLVGLQFLLAWILVRSKTLQKLVVRDPVALVYRGRVLELPMKRARVTLNDIHAVLRKGGVGRVESVALVVLESDGTFSVVPQQSEDEITVLCGLESQLEGIR